MEENDAQLKEALHLDLGRTDFMSELVEIGGVTEGIRHTLAGIK
jgi:hypothetical protein